MAIALPCLLAPAVARSQVPPVPRFVDETDAAGIQSRFDGDWEYTVGGGVAALRPPVSQSKRPPHLR